MAGAKARPRSNTERGRASRLRAAARVRTLTPAERRWLGAYERATSRYASKRERERATSKARKRAEKKRRAPKIEPGETGLRAAGSAKKDAIAIVKSLLIWGEAPGADIQAEWYEGREPRPGRPGSALAKAHAAQRLFWLDESSGALPMFDLPDIPRSNGRAANIRARIQIVADGRKRLVWVSLAPLQVDWTQLFYDAIERLADLLNNAPSKTDDMTVHGWSAYVTGTVFTSEAQWLRKRLEASAAPRGVKRPKKRPKKRHGGRST